MTNPYGDPKEVVPYRFLQVIILVIIMLGGGWLIGDGIEDSERPANAGEALE